MNWTWRKIGVIGGVALAALLLIGLIVDQMLLPWTVSFTDTITVPSVVGKNVATATRMLQDAGLAVMEPREQNSATAVRGAVMSQLPYADATVKKGRRIYLTVSKGMRTIRVPSLYGMSVRDARLVLLRVGLVLGDVTYEPHNEVSIDRIAGQGIPSGAEIPADGIINVVVSRGNNSVRIPSLVGLSLDEARNVLLSAGLSLGSITEKESSAFDPGIILSQTPPADSAVALGSLVDIGVTR